MSKTKSLFFNKNTRKREPSLTLLACPIALSTVISADQSWGVELKLRVTSCSKWKKQYKYPGHLWKGTIHCSQGRGSQASCPHISRNSQHQVSLDQGSPGDILVRWLGNKLLSITDIMVYVHDFKSGFLAKGNQTGSCVVNYLRYS